MDSLSLAMLALCLPSRHQMRAEEAKYAGVIGMAGTAAEQALAAILVQVHGDEAAYVAGSQFKTASQVLQEVKELLQQPVSRSSFLTTGIEAPEAHREELLVAAKSFASLMSFRAAGLHGGRGVGIDAAVALVGRVHQFLSVLARSSRIKPYLETLPIMPVQAKQTEVLLQDLVAQLNSAQSLPDQAHLLRSIFLVLPDTPVEEPEWLAAIDRVSVVPTAGDVALLMATAQASIPARLRRVAGSGPAIAVAIRPHVPGAIPVAAVHLRREFNSLSDQFAHDSASANGRLLDGVLHLPPADFLFDMFLLPNPQLREELGHDTLTGQQAWPFIAAAVAEPRTTPRPYWFLIQLVAPDQLDHLRGYLVRAARVAGRRSFTENLTEVLDGLQHIRENTAPPADSPWVVEISRTLLCAQKGRADLMDALRRQSGKERDLPESLRQWIAAYSDGRVDATETWQILQEFKSTIPELSHVATWSYWTRLLAQASYQPNDRQFLVHIARDREIAAPMTAARKALRAIDAHMYGPAIAVDL
ncbi:hypothetical protein ACOTFF_15895 [Achromobacter xylosoxidans]